MISSMVREKMRTEKLNRFWATVLKCQHKNLSPNYLELFRCGTPYCSGDEVHCLDCGAYISSCGCMSENGISGWPHSRYRTEVRKRNERQKTVA